MAANPLIDLKTSWEKFSYQVHQHPQLAGFFAWWQKYHRHIKLAAAALFLLIMIIFGLQLGLSLADKSSLPDVAPPPIATVTPTVTTTVTTPLNQLRTEVERFQLLLPDPAPPAVDHDITLKEKRF